MAGNLRRQVLKPATFSTTSTTSSKSKSSSTSAAAPASPTSTSVSVVAPGGSVSSATGTDSTTISSYYIVESVTGTIYTLETIKYTLVDGATLDTQWPETTVVKALTDSVDGSTKAFTTVTYTTFYPPHPAVPTPSSVPSTSTSTSSTSSSTTSNGASPTTSSQAVKTIKTGTKTGVVAGVAIACLLGGALIAALLVFFLMRRRNARNNRSRSTRSNGFEEKRTSPTTAPLLGTGAGAVAATAWERHLPQSESDSTMRNAVQATLTQVELHVDNYYRDTAVPVTSELQSELMGLKLDTHLPDSIIGLLPQTRSPTLLIKHCLAQLVVSRITVDEAGDNNMMGDSFLPADFTALAGATGSSRNISSKPAYAPALSRHRQLTNYLRPPPATDRTYLSTRDARISRAADTFTAAFSPWARPTQSPDARRAHLVSVLKAAADTGILVFSQPSSFRWVWDMPRSGGGGGLKVVVLPGFVKFADETAKVLDRPQMLVEPTVNSLT